MKVSLKLAVFIILGLFTVVSCSKDDSIKPNPTPKFEVSSTDVDFGIVEIEKNKQKEVTITNKGDGELKLIDFSFVGANNVDFSSDAVNNTVLIKDKSYSFKITFNPKTAGNKTAVLNITTNTATEVYVVNVRGNVLSDSELKDKQDAWIYFKDKPNAKSFLANPTKMLSAKAIERRSKQGISLDNKDVPIEKSYYKKVKNSESVTVLAKSKWLNAVHIQAPQKVIEALKNSNDFISKVEYADRTLNGKTKSYYSFSSSKYQNKFESVTTDFVYGTTETQVKMLKADVLHQKGFTGKGVVIAVIDAGFPNVNTIAPFKRIRDNKQILGGYDFVERSTNFYTGNNHGTHVLSTIAGYIKSEETNFVGTAPDASFYLFRSENADKEEPVEESLWVEAAERADSLGVDIINTSLGYTKFDNPKYSHVYADLNGETAFMSRGAEIAASRGMIVINAAGNEGDKDWKYIGVPADAKSVLTVGAVTHWDNGVANFSSRGPSADNRIKPDVMALGFLSAIVRHDKGDVGYANGTSFASPIMAGAVACLRQAYPNKKASEIVEQVKKGGDKYTAPDNNHGYGVPNFEQVYNNMK